MPIDKYDYQHRWHVTFIYLVAYIYIVPFMQCQELRLPNVACAKCHICQVLLVPSVICVKCCMPSVNCVSLSRVSIVLRLPSIMCVNSSPSRVKCHMYQVSCVSSGTWVKCHMYSIKYHVCQMSSLSIMSHVSYITCLVSFIRCEIEFAELNFTCQMLQVYVHVTEITGKVYFFSMIKIMAYSWVP